MNKDIHLNPEFIEGFEKELRRGSLVLVVLSMLIKPTHGYELLTLIEKAKINMDTDTLYPLLRRLESQGLLEGKWDVTSNRPRKVYGLTPMGSSLLEAMKKIWQQYGKNIERIIDHD
jgi:PadR family transcriptional regulator, regulatory protein PadR